MAVVTNMRMLITETVTRVDKIRNENRYGCLLENMLLKERMLPYCSPWGCSMA